VDWIDQAYVNRVSVRLERFRQKSPGRWNFRCPVCGDSAKDPTKTRGWLFDKNGEVKFHCFNDDTCGSNFSYFLFRMDPALAAEYRLEKFREYGGKQNARPTAIEFEKEPEKEPGDPAHVECLQTIASLPKDHFARQYIEDRKIPMFFMDKLYFTEHWKALTNQFEPNTYETIWKDEARIVIPAYNAAKKLSCFQGRSLDPEVDEKKYLTVKVLDELKIWGMDRLQKNKPAFLLEGAFDAMFLDNTTAMLGGLMNPGDLPAGYDWVFVLDNEPRNQSVLRRYQQLINKRAKFVSWHDWKYPYKDVNLCVQNGVRPADIQRYFETHTVSGLTAQLHFDRWRKLPL
jgi:hypothetical protein